MATWEKIERDPEKERPSQLPAKRPRTGWKHFAAAALIVGVALLAYSNSFYVPFQFDDLPNILRNSSVHLDSLAWGRMLQLIHDIYKSSIRVVSYSSLALNYYYSRFDVFSYHVVNWVIHVMAGVLLYGLLVVTFSLPSLQKTYGTVAYRTALFATLIFVAHPIQTQSVTYIVQRMTSLAAMFYLLSLFLYAKGRLSRGVPRFAFFTGTVLSYLLGILSKENAAILPLFVCLYEFFFFQNLELGPRGKRGVVMLIGVFVLMGVLGWLLWGKRYLQFTIEGYAYHGFTMKERGLTQFRVVVYYLTLLIYPHPSRLNLDYDFPISKGILTPPTTLLSILIVGGLIGYSIWTAKKRPVVSFWILWYFGNLFVESSIFPLDIIFEHRLYLPSVGPFVLFSLFVVSGMERLKVRRVAKMPERATAPPV